MSLARIVPVIQQRCRAVWKVYKIQFVGAVYPTGTQILPTVFLWLLEKGCLCITLKRRPARSFCIALYAEMYLMPDILLLLVVNCGNMSPIVLKKNSSGVFEVQNVVQPDFLSFAAFTAYNQKFLMVTAK